MYVVYSNLTAIAISVYLIATYLLSFRISPFLGSLNILLETDAYSWGEPVMYSRETLTYCLYHDMKHGTVLKYLNGPGNSSVDTDHDTNETT